MNEESIRWQLHDWALELFACGGDFSIAALEAAQIEGSRAYRSGHSVAAAFEVGRAAFYQTLSPAVAPAAPQF